MGKKKKVLSNTSGHAYQTEKKKKKKRKAGQYMGSSVPELAHFQSVLMLSR